MFYVVRSTFYIVRFTLYVLRCTFYVARVTFDVSRSRLTFTLYVFRADIRADARKSKCAARISATALAFAFAVK